ncbi:26S proteasome non-ATPase regulatory subunit 1-like protein [Trifolium pratense]|uniref:26S proteasome non-ATPase regulatory subunit 1-like protein n=1 Tax=Trifolium pratense TaxID=57577 RepID=A0A2K3KUB9_TRIPR|nr:26S proteasome non-ATPase regulatory subunit 1-like protein [Trifolium pratense]
MIVAPENFIKFLHDNKYVPVKLAPLGFVLLKDLRPTEPEVLAITDTSASTTSTSGGLGPGLQSSSSAMVVDEEPQPPQP